MRRMSGRAGAMGLVVLACRGQFRPALELVRLPKGVVWYGWHDCTLICFSVFPSFHDFRTWNLTEIGVSVKICGVGSYVCGGHGRNLGHAVVSSSA